MKLNGCDTGRVQYARKEAVPGKAERCKRCNAWHAKTDHPKSRRRKVH